MTNRQLARLHSTLRVRLRLRQQDVAAAAGLNRGRVTKLEAGQIDELKVGEVRSCFDALGARLDLVAAYRGAQQDRLLDELHAAILGAVVAILRSDGWEVRIEVSFAIGGERGSIDVVAWKADETALLVVEVKSELPGIDPLLRPLDVKVRLAARVVGEFGWQPLSVSRIVVLPEDSSCRRQVERHGPVLDQALSARSREVRAWLRRPVGVLAGLWFLSIALPRDRRRNPSAVRRVKRPRSRTSGYEKRPSRAPDGALDPGLRMIDPHRCSAGRRLTGPSPSCSALTLDNRRLAALVC